MENEIGVMAAPKAATDEEIGAMPMIRIEGMEEPQGMGAFQAKARARAFDLAAAKRADDESEEAFAGMPTDELRSRLEYVRLESRARMMMDNADSFGDEEFGSVFRELNKRRFIADDRSLAAFDALDGEGKVTNRSRLADFLAFSDRLSAAKTADEQQALLGDKFASPALKAWREAKDNGASVAYARRKLEEEGRSWGDVGASLLENANPNRILDRLVGGTPDANDKTPMFEWLSDHRAVSEYEKKLLGDELRAEAAKVMPFLTKAQRDLVNVYAAGGEVAQGVFKLMKPEDREMMYSMCQAVRPAADLNWLSEMAARVGMGVRSAWRGARRADVGATDWIMNKGGEFLLGKSNLWSTPEEREAIRRDMLDDIHWAQSVHDLKLKDPEGFLDKALAGYADSASMQYSMLGGALARSWAKPLAGTRTGVALAVGGLALESYAALAMIGEQFDNMLMHGIEIDKAGPLAVCGGLVDTYVESMNLKDWFGKSLAPAEMKRVGVRAALRAALKMDGKEFMRVLRTNAKQAFKIAGSEVREELLQGMNQQGWCSLAEGRDALDAFTSSEAFQAGAEAFWEALPACTAFGVFGAANVTGSVARGANGAYAEHLQEVSRIVARKNGVSNLDRKGEEAAWRLSLNEAQRIVEATKGMTVKERNEWINAQEDLTLAEKQFYAEHCDMYEASVAQDGQAWADERLSGSINEAMFAKAGWKFEHDEKGWVTGVTTANGERFGVDFRNREATLDDLSDADKAALVEAWNREAADGEKLGGVDDPRLADVARQVNGFYSNGKIVLFGARATGATLGHEATHGMIDALSKIAGRQARRTVKALAERLGGRVEGGKLDVGADEAAANRVEDIVFAREVANMDVAPDRVDVRALGKNLVTALRKAVGLGKGRVFLPVVRTAEGVEANPEEYLHDLVAESLAALAQREANEAARKKEVAEARARHKAEREEKRQRKIELRRAEAERVQAEIEAAKKAKDEELRRAAREAHERNLKEAEAEALRKKAEDEFRERLAVLEDRRRAAQAVAEYEAWKKDEAHKEEVRAEQEKQMDEILAEIAAEEQKEIDAINARHDAEARLLAEEAAKVERAREAEAERQRKMSEKMLENRRNAVKTMPRLWQSKHLDGEGAQRVRAAYEAAWRAKSGKFLSQSDVDQLAEVYGLPPEAVNLKKTKGGYRLVKEQLLSDEALGTFNDGLVRLYSDIANVKIVVPDVVVATAEDAANAVPNEVWDPVSGTFVEGRVVIDPDAAKTFREQAGREEPTVTPAEIEAARTRHPTRFSIRDNIGTRRGVTVKVDTKNPKTADGKNTIIFRRDPMEVVGLVAAAEPIDASANPMPDGIVVGDKDTPYTVEEKKRIRKFVKDCARAQAGDVENAEFGNIHIGRDFVDEISNHSISTAREIAAVSSAREIAARMVHFAASPNEEVAKRDGIDMMEYGVAKVRLGDGLYLVMGEVGVRNSARPYYDQRVVAKLKADATSTLHGDNEVESAFDTVYDNRFRMILQGGAALSAKARDLAVEKQLYWENAVQLEDADKAEMERALAEEGKGAKRFSVGDMRATLDPEAWGDLSREVRVVGGGSPTWVYPKRTKVSANKPELERLAYADVERQENFEVDPDNGDRSLVIDGTRIRIAKSGLFHGADRRLEKIGNAIANIGSVLNSSVAVPNTEGDYHYRVAETNFGRPEFVLITLKRVGNADAVANLSRVYAVNVKAGSAAQGVIPTSSSRSNGDIVSNLRAAWQGAFLPGIEKHAATRFSVGRDAAAERARREYDEVVARCTNADGTKKDGWLKAPNGKDTNLDERQWVQVRTPSFKRWFGDWENDPANASKVVDENGEPKVVYHGTMADFNAFNGGAFLTPDYYNADGYANGERVIDAFANVRDPLVIDCGGRKWDDLDTPFGASTAGIVQSDEAKKHDGVIFENVKDSWIDDEDAQEADTVYYANTPSQIKSATDNTGAFDEGDDDIRFSMRVNPNLRREVGEVVVGRRADGTKVGRHGRVVFSSMPDILKWLGLPDLEIETDRARIAKIVAKHHLTTEQIADLPNRYDKPASVFRDGANAYVVLTDMIGKTDGGADKPVMVRLTRKDGRKGETVFVASAYPREIDKEVEYVRLANTPGAALFVDKDKVATLGLEEGTTSTLCTLADRDDVMTPGDFSSFVTARIVSQNGVGAQGGETRFSIVKDKDLLDRLNGEKTVRVYRAMQVIDGKLYPPMAAKVDGGLVEAAPLGAWLMADERPDLVRDGKFKLDKANGSAIAAAYNPYFHTSRSPLNDQFSSAYKRPNLVTVECEVPASELTSGYRAEGAKDAVGEMAWHSGPVSSRLAKVGAPRRVILSRYVKVVRVVPDAEVAQTVKKMLDGKGIAIPSNVVTPSLRAELEKAGVAVEDRAATRFSLDVGDSLADRSKYEQVVDALSVRNAAPTNVLAADATPKDAAQHFAKNLLGKVLTMPDGETFEIRAGHFFRLTCEGKHKGFVEGYRNGEEAFAAIVNGEVPAEKINGYRQDRAVMLPLFSDVVEHPSVVLKNGNVSQFIKRYETADGRAMTAVFRMFEDGRKILSFHGFGARYGELKHYRVAYVSDAARAGTSPATSGLGTGSRADGGIVSQNGVGAQGGGSVRVEVEGDGIVEKVKRLARPAAEPGADAPRFSIGDRSAANVAKFYLAREIMENKGRMPDMRRAANVARSLGYGGSLAELVRSAQTEAAQQTQLLRYLASDPKTEKVLADAGLALRNERAVERARSAAIQFSREVGEAAEGTKRATERAVRRMKGEDYERMVVREGLDLDAILRAIRPEERAASKDGEKGEGDGAAEATAALTDADRALIAQKAAEAIANGAEAVAKAKELVKAKEDADAAKAQDGGKDAGGAADADEDGEGDGADDAHEGAVAKAIRETVAKAGFTLDSPEAMVQLVKAITEKYVRDFPGEFANLDADDPWSSPLVRAKFAANLASFAQSVADAYAPSYARVRVASRAQMLNDQGLTTVRQIEEAGEALFRDLHADVIRQSRAALIRDIKKLVKPHAKHYAENELKKDRQVDAALGRYCKFAYRVMGYSAKKCEERAAQLEQELAGWAGVEDADRDRIREFADRKMELEMIDMFGNLRSRMPAELADLRDFVEQTINESRWEAMQFGEKWEAARHEAAQKAAGGIVGDPKRGGVKPEAGETSGLYSLIGMLEAKARQLTRWATGAAREDSLKAFGAVEEMIQGAEDRQFNYMQGEKAKFVDLCATVYGDHVKAGRALTAEIDRSLWDSLDRGGQKTAWTVGRVMQMYVSCVQSDYADNCAKWGRDAAYVRHLEDVLNALDPRHMDFVEGLRGIYREQGAALDEVMRRTTGTTLLTPNRLYMPVKMFRDDNIAQKARARAYSPFAPSLTPRVKNGLDFRQDVDIVDMWQERMADAAHTIGWADAGSMVQGVLQSDSVLRAIRDAHGDKVLGQWQRYVLDILAGAEQGKVDSSNWGVAAMRFCARLASRTWLALNPASWAKQLGAVPCFALSGDGDLRSVAKSVSFVALRPFEAAKVMRDLAGTAAFQARYGVAISQEMKYATSGEGQFRNWISRIMDWSMKGIMGFDKLGVYALAGVYHQKRCELETQGKGAEEASELASSWLMHIVDKTAQTTRAVNTTELQRAGGAWGILLQFKSAPAQQTQFEITAIQDALAHPEDAKRWKKAAVCVLVNHVIVPTINTAIESVVACLTSWGAPDEEKRRRLVEMWIANIVSGSLGSVVFIGTVAEGVGSLLGKVASGGDVNMYDLRNSLGRQIPAAEMLNLWVNQGDKAIKALLEVGDGDIAEGVEDMAFALGAVVPGLSWISRKGKQALDSAREK